MPPGVGEGWRDGTAGRNVRSEVDDGVLGSGGGEGGCCRVGGDGREGGLAVQVLGWRRGVV